MSTIDWLMVFGTFVFLASLAYRSRKYTRSVADFLSANRCAGRYLLGTAEGAAGLGAISIIALFEKGYSTGFAPNYWNAISIPIGLFITLSGWVIYRFRETRAMTMAQFFEIRYSRRFRIFAGILAWTSGIINFGIFPGVGARFFVSFCGLPEHNIMIGSVSISLTYALVMAVLLIVAVFFTLSGGQIAVLITDFWQGLISLIFITLIVLFIWFTVSWGTMKEALVLASEPGKSLFNPYDIGRADFDFGFFLIGYFFALYNFMAWQGNQGYRSSAASPHEAKMSNVVGGLRSGFITLGMILMPVLAIVILNHPDFLAMGSQVSESLQQMYPDNEQLRKQMRVPVALREMLPVGLLGGFAASMFAFFISTHNTYMHSWGSIFIQDVILPLRGDKPFRPEQHLRYLRYSVIGVAVFIYCFSLVFPPRDYIFMFFAITGAIYLGGAGAVIIGGLYWKRGTTGAAWTAMITGSVLALSSILAQQFWTLDAADGFKKAYYSLEPEQTIILSGTIKPTVLPNGDVVQAIESRKFRTGKPLDGWLDADDSLSGTTRTLGEIKSAINTPMRVRTSIIRNLAPGWMLVGDAHGQMVARLPEGAIFERGDPVFMEGVVRLTNAEERAALDPDGAWSTLDGGRFLDATEASHPSGGIEQDEGMKGNLLVEKIRTSGTITEEIENNLFVVEAGESNLYVRLNPDFPYNGQYLAFFSAIAAIAGYILVSLIRPGRIIDFERILHRGRHRVKEEEAVIRERNPEEQPVAWYWRMIGVNGREFSKIDKALFLFTFGYGMWGIGGFLVLAFFQANGWMTDDRWFVWWRLSLFIQLGLAIIGGLWVTVGGMFDLRKLYRRLSVIKRDEFDDGRVVGHQNLADVAEEEDQPPSSKSPDSSESKP